MGEFGFIEGIRAAFSAVGGSGFGYGIEGIGDDCAVMPLGDGRSMVVTTDMLVEGSHFLREAATAREIGRKSLAVNLSDVAAMGARPVASLLSLGLPAECTGEWAAGFMEGYRELSERYGVALAGGDTTVSHAGVAVNVVAIGVVPDANIKRRSGAREGDLVCVTGRLGASGAGLRHILAGDCGSPLAHEHHNPEPHVRQGQWLGARSEVHAMIDLSDGLASDLVHVLKASGVGAQVELNDIPTDHTLEDALAAGEDYKLLFTVDAAAALEEFRREIGEVYVVGRIVAGAPQIEWLRDGAAVDTDWHGFTHF